MKRSLILSIVILFLAFIGNFCLSAEKEERSLG